MRQPSAKYGIPLLVSALLVAACSRGPDEDTLRADLQSRLDVGFEAGLFAVRSFRRTGSAPFQDVERGVSGVYVYYDAQVAFLRDYSLTSWRGLNLGTLAFALGATSHGIEGFDPAGNRAGDPLRVHGRLSYRARDGAWQALDEGVPPLAKEAARPTSLEGSGPGAVLEGVRRLLERQPHPTRGTRDAVIVRELARSAARIDLGFARLEGRMTLATAEPPGTYREFGTAFAEHATAQGLPMHSHSSEGSVQNGLDVHAMRVDFALVQSDVAEILFKGWSEEDQIARPNLRSMASLWPEALHLLALEGSGIERLEDLRGKRVAVGYPGSGTRFTAIRVTTAAGLRRGDLTEIHQLGLAESIAALEGGEVDALFAVEAVPSPAFQALFQRRPEVRIVSIDPGIVDRLSKRHFAYYPFRIPARTYPGQTEPFATLAMAAVLVTNEMEPDERVEAVLAMLLDSTDALSKVFFRAGFISQETMRLGIALPLHPAAERFYARRERERQAEAAEADSKANRPRRESGATRP